MSHERQTVKNREGSVYKGVIKYRCNKLDGFENLPTYKTFYNNQKLGIWHSKQYDEKNRLAEENRQIEEKERVRKQAQKVIEKRNVEANKRDKTLRVRILEEAKEQEAERKEDEEKRRKRLSSKI